MVEQAIISYGRAGKVETLKAFPKARIWCCEEEEKEYRKYYDNLVIVPMEHEGSISKKRNYVLDHSKSKYVLLLDDDIRRLRYLEAQEKHDFPLEDLDFWLLRNFKMCEDLGTVLWGIRNIPDPGIYLEYHPFNLSSHLAGPLQGHVLPHGLRYDLKADLKEDYDMTLQALQKYRKVLRFEKFYVLHRRAKNPGGAVRYRTKKRELEALRYLQKKWGNRIVKGRQRNILNTRVRAPL